MVVALFTILILGLLQVSAVPESSAEEEIEVEEADLSVTADGPSAVTAGDNAVYTIIVINNGPNDAENVVVKYFLSDNVSYVSATPELSCTLRLGDSLVRCDVDSIVSGSTVTITVAVKVNGNAVGTIKNFVEVYSDADDPNFDNDSDEISTKVNGPPPTVNVKQSSVQKQKTQQFTIPAHVLEAIKLKSKPTEPVGKLQ
ncbi:MAG: DUF11 domain-containing protein, partial [Nitrososphaerales archaeon]